jgi:hypothetical protein
MGFHTRVLLEGLAMLLIAMLVAGAAVILLVRYRTIRPARAQHLPTARGAVALLLPVVASVLYPAILPGRVATLGDWQFGWSVSPISRIIGVVLMLICIATFIEALRRGSRIDRTVAWASSLFGFVFIYEVFQSYFYTARP